MTGTPDERQGIAQARSPDEPGMLRKKRRTSNERVSNMTVSKRPVNRPHDLALAALLSVAARLTRESLSMHPPHMPLHPDGRGGALVDHDDLSALGQAHRDYLAAVVDEPAPDEETS